jgi:DNA invertase Pin-like site-specific DNA recombinase
MPSKSFLKNAIVYSRISKMNNTLNKPTLSLESQENEINNYLISKNIPIYKSFKDIGSAYKQRRDDLISILKHCDNKLLVVYEASRLSRNVKYFTEIHNICKKHNHDIFIVNINKKFFIHDKKDSEYLFDLIKDAEKESRLIGERISRTLKMKKEQQNQYYKSLGHYGSQDITEKKIYKLIHLLATKGSYIAEIRDLVRDVTINYENFEPFQIIEYDDDGNENYLQTTVLPYEMSNRNILDTLNAYKIKIRGENFKLADISLILSQNLNMDIDMDLNNDEYISEIENMQLDSTNTPNSETSISQYKWMTFLYNPSIGLPPNIEIPKGVELPNTSMMICIPYKEKLYIFETPTNQMTKPISHL